MVDLRNDTEKGKMKTKLLHDPKNYNHIILTSKPKKKNPKTEFTVQKIYQ